MDHLKEITISKPGVAYYQDLKIKVPRFCPHCDQAISPITIEFLKTNYSDGQSLNIFLHRCPDCNKHFLTTHLRNEPDRILEHVATYPSMKNKHFHKLIEETSPRFVKIYNQAYTAEQLNHFEIAGTGYRLALEILIKDFAIKCLGKNPDEVKRKKLADAIREYLDDQESFTSADVVRILGNDYVHYHQKYEDVEFEHLKWYLDMFIKKVEAKLLFLNPPVPTRQLEKTI
jgi:hypothetical protein